MPTAKFNTFSLPGLLDFFSEAVPLSCILNKITKLGSFLAITFSSV